MLWPAAMSAKQAASWAAALLLAGCAAGPAPAPAPAPAVSQPPPAAAPAAPPPEPGSGDWSLRPLTPGDWTYDGREARYAGFALRCDSAGRRVQLEREGAGGPLRIRTSYGERSLPPGGFVGADDPLLDEIVFSRGRFAVEAAGSETLIVPAWAEPGRVVEDCRS